MNSHNKYNSYIAVIGGGSGGLTVAIGLAQVGKKVVLIERGHMGGDCTNTGCIPSKALLHAAKNKPKSEVMSYVRNVRMRIREEESVSEIEKHGIEVLLGDASFINDTTLKVVSADKQEHTLTPSKIIIATGSSPRSISIPGLAKEKTLTNESVFELDHLPESLVIVGVGPIGLEMAQAFCDAGTQVSVLYRGERELKYVHPHTSENVIISLEKSGVTFWWKVTNIKYSSGQIRFLSDKQDQSVKSSNVLLAVGRRPNIEQLNLDATTISYDEHGIQVNSRFRTSVKHIYAIGDVLGGAQYTHMANAQGREVVKQLLSPLLPSRTITDAPSVIYIRPELAVAGKSLSSIDNISALVGTITVNMTDMDRAKTDDISDGHITVWYMRLTGKVLRVEILAPHAGEMISYWALVIHRRIWLWTLYPLVLPYPTLSLASKKVADVFMAKTLPSIHKEFYGLASHVLKGFVRTHARLLLAIVLWLMLLIGVSHYMSQQRLSFVDIAQQMASFLENSPLGLVFYYLVYALRFVVLFPATLLAMIAGFLWGAQNGYVHALVAGTLSACIPYFVGKWFGGTYEHSSKLKRYTQTLKKHPFETTLFMRMIYLPYDLVSVVVGASGASFGTFIIATFIGNLLGTLGFVLIGASFDHQIQEGSLAIDPVFIFLSLLILFTGLSFSYVLKKVKFLSRQR